MIIHCYPHHVVVGISSGRNSMKANSRIIREINKPMLNAEKRMEKENITHQEPNEAISSVSIVMPSLNDKSYLGFRTLCFYFPTKMLHLNASFVPLKCSVNAHT